MKEYHAICAAGAKALTDAMVKTAMAERVYVFAIHGGGNGPENYGYILPLRESEGYPDAEAAPNGFTCVNPPYCDRWESLPYHGLHGALYEACKRVPLF